MVPEDWKVDELPDDFADRVMARLDREEGASRPVPLARPRRRRLLLAAALVAAAALAAGVTVKWGMPVSHGETAAHAREQVKMGSRAVAVLETGAHVSWRGDAVEQTAGDVFYRVEPGATFRVHTPAGDVDVLGTCFRVQIEEGETNVNARDVKVGLLGAALGMTALVSVYEGKVAVSRAQDRVTLTAGERARADSRGVRRETTADEAAASADGSNAAVAKDPLLVANENLAESVRDYRRKLEAIEAQKKTMEKQLADAQTKLEQAAKDGKVAPLRSDYDLSEDDWKQLAKDGTVKARYPCLRPKPKKDEVSPSDLQKSGLSADDGATVQRALEASRGRIWGTIRPLCVSAMHGDAAVVDKLGPSTCESLVRDVAAANGADVAEEMRQVAEIRAGMRPAPADGGTPLVKMMLALTGETKAVADDLSQSLGPEEAKRLVYGEDGVGCWNNSTWGVGPRSAPPPK